MASSRQARVHLLGTAGGPDVWRRAGTAVAISVGDAVYQVDFGIGTCAQFRRAGLEPSQIKAAFVTHLHSDHIAEAYTFFTANWYYMSQVVPMYGPPSDSRLNLDDGHVVVSERCPKPGLAETLRAFQSAFAYDNNIRVRDEAMPDLLRRVWAGDPSDGPGIDPRELEPTFEPGRLIYEDENVRVTGACVLHPPIWPAYAFRFDTETGSVTVSGDTRPSDELVALAKGSDLLLHEVIDLDWLHAYATRDGVPPALVNHLLQSHTADRSYEDGGKSVRGVGKIAAEAEVKQLVLYHLTPAVDFLPGGEVIELDDREWLDEVKAEFPGGSVKVGADLDVFEV